MILGIAFACVKLSGGSDEGVISNLMDLACV